MNVKRFTARNSREALRLVREALGEDAVVLSTKPSGSSVEVLAMAPEGLRQVEQMAVDAAAEAPARAEPGFADTSVAQDVARLQMSTLSFQDYVRNRMLKRRRAALHGGLPDAPVGARGGLGSRVDVRVDDDTEFPAVAGATPAAHDAAAASAARGQARAGDPPGRLEQRMAERSGAVADAAAPREPLHSGEPIRPAGGNDSLDLASARADRSEMLAELRSMKGLIEERFGALAFMEKLQRRPVEARLTQKLLDCGFSPALIRKIAEGLGTETADETAWVASVLER